MKKELTLRVTDLEKKAIAFCKEKEIPFPIANYLVEFATEATKELQEEIATLKHNKKTVAHLSSCISDVQEKKIKDLEAQLEQEKNLSQCRFDHNEQLRETVKKARNLVHRLLVVIQRHRWWNYEVMDEARAFMSEVDHDKDHD